MIYYPVILGLINKPQPLFLDHISTNQHDPTPKWVLNIAEEVILQVLSLRYVFHGLRLRGPFNGTTVDGDSGGRGWNGGDAPHRWWWKLEMWRLPEKTASQMTMRTCEPSVPLKKVFIWMFFLLHFWWIDPLMLWDRELLEVPCCSSVQLNVFFVVFLFPGIWQIL